MIKVRSCPLNINPILHFKYIFNCIIQAEVPGVQVEGQVGRKKSFEILVKDQEIHSKLKTMSFPNFEEVVSIIKTVSEGGGPSTVQKTIGPFTI